MTMNDLQGMTPEKRQQEPAWLKVMPFTSSNFVIVKSVTSTIAQQWRTVARANALFPTKISGHHPAQPGLLLHCNRISG
ncbi:hypothetical protein [Polaromonas sp.]|uniref:hypothetical protein n=1 Tax=Polaromonas sp. TaxID=1869339 RepID=UPI00326663C5